MNRLYGGVLLLLLISIVGCDDATDTPTETVIVFAEELGSGMHAHEHPRVLPKDRDLYQVFADYMRAQRRLDDAFRQHLGEPMEDPPSPLLALMRDPTSVTDADATIRDNSADVPLPTGGSIKLARGKTWQVDLAATIGMTETADLETQAATWQTLTPIYESLTTRIETGEVTTRDEALQALLQELIVGPMTESE